MTRLYPNPCYNEVCFKGTALDWINPGVNLSICSLPEIKGYFPFFFYTRINFVI